MLGRKCAALIITALILAFACVGYAAAQAQPAPPMQTFRLYAGLWRVDESFNSTIRIKNLLVVSTIQVTPVLHFADGAEYALPPVELAKAGLLAADTARSL